MELRRFIPLVLTGAVVTGLLSACSGDDDDSARIRLGLVGRADVTEVVEAPATVAARATATLRSPAEGTIGRLRVSDGDDVRKGQVLARIDSPVAEEQLRQAREADRGASGGGLPAGVDLSSLQRSTDRTARRGFAAARRVAAEVPDAGQRALVLAQITKAEAEYATAAAAAQSAVGRLNAGLGSVDAALSSITAAQRVQTRAAVRAAERTVEGLTIRAPFSGVASLGGPAGGAGDLSGLIGRLPAGLRSQASAAGGAVSSPGGTGGATDATSVAEGAPIASGDAVITVTDASRLTLSADVDETDVLQVTRGVAASVEFDAVPGATYPARVTGVGVTPRESDGGGVTYKVTLSLERGTMADGATAPWPKPGMSAVVDLRVREVTGVLSVPSAAVVTSGRDSTVWVVSAGRAQRRVVSLGAEGDTVVQVAAGLREGERVVVRGVDAVRQGEELSGR